MAPQKKTFSDKDWDKIELYMKAGATQARIATSFGMHIETFNDRIKERYGDTYSSVCQEFNMMGRLLVEATQLQKALSGNTEMLKWVGKFQCGQRDGDITPLGAPLQDQINLSHENMMLRHENTLLKERCGITNKPSGQSSTEPEAEQEFLRGDPTF